MTPGEEMAEAVHALIKAEITYTLRQNIAREMRKKGFMDPGRDQTRLKGEVNAAFQNLVIELDKEIKG